MDEQTLEEMTVETENSKLAEPEHSDAEEMGEAQSAESIEALRAEICELKELIKTREEQQRRLTREIGEFSELFPETAVQEIPENIWDEVRRGIPLAAAFALHRRRIDMEEARVRGINQKNAHLSAGMAGKDAPKEYYTPEEVRAMSRAEVRANYTKIIESMKKWN